MRRLGKKAGVGFWRAPLTCDANTPSLHRSQRDDLKPHEQKTKLTGIKLEWADCYHVCTMPNISVETMRMENMYEEYVGYI